MTYAPTMDRDAAAKPTVVELEKSFYLPRAQIRCAYSPARFWRTCQPTLTTRAE